MEKTVGELAGLVGGQVIGEQEKIISGISGAEDAGSGEIAFAQNDDFLQQAKKGAAAVIVTPELAKGESEKTLIVVDNPRLAFAKIADLFTPKPYYNPGISSRAVVSDKAQIGEGVSIHPGVVIDDEAQIGDSVILAPGVYVGKEVEIGTGSLLHPQVVIEYDSKIGSEVEINAGTIVGAEGYGFETGEAGHVKVPQFGNVIIEDRVELGANVTVDRGATGSTVVGAGTKIDNLVHIAHNVKIGSDCLIIAQVGISGSTEIGDEVTLAGKTGVAGHLKIGNNTTVAAASVVTHDIESGSYVSGYPAHNHRKERRIKVSRKRLPKMVKKLRKLEQEVKKLKAKLGEEE